MSDNGKQTTILVIDDEAVVRQSYSDCLEDLGYETCMAENGQVGIEVFENENVDLVLVDLRMPVMDGLEVLSKITKMSPDTPLIVASGTGVIGDAVEALRQGAWDYLLKPVKDFSVLSHAVESALEKARLKRENRKYQLYLEQMITERTEELHQANDNLYQINRRLRESELQFRTILDNIRAGVVIVQLDSMEVLYVNPTAAELIGSPASEIVSSHCNDVFCPSIEEQCNMHDFKNENDSTERILKTSDGRQIPILKTITQTIYDGKDCLLESFIDLTAQKEAASEKAELEKQLYQAQKLEELGQLVGGVTHDFNNMLAGILGAAEILKENACICEEDSKCIDMIIKSSTRATEFASKLLMFSRKAPHSTSSVDLHSIIRDSVALLERSLDKKISIGVEMNASKHFVMGDNSQLQSSLMNICINASHAMPDGGEISISSSNVIFDETCCEASPFNIEPGEFVEITINDKGSGIPEENLLKIFEPFFTTKEKAKGTGLGLSVVYGIIKNHNGAITVNSELGVGTTFHIFLPCSTEKSEQTTKNETIHNGCGKILLVDDEETIRLTSKAMLENLGYDIILAEDGKAAVDLFKKERDNIDIVILDMVMPVMDGRKAFEEIKGIDENAKVIISSGFSKPEDLAILMEKGLAGFIRKPYRLFELSQLILEALSGDKKP